VLTLGNLSPPKTAMVDGINTWHLTSLARFKALIAPSTLTLRALSGYFSPKAESIAAK
jgi:hypothetical protein